MAANPPVRLITMAWGESYINELVDFALPALLAPGNLPALYSIFDCELVIVTQEAAFARLREHRVFKQLERLCPVDLRPIDEFVSTPDAYGMALTYSLFRGFEDLGPRMLDTQLIFFNSDFIMADGSLASVARRILDGERLILAPSYCVVRERVVPLLRSNVDPETAALSLSPRQMAAIALEHRHNTVRGKTLNQSAFSMEWIDQFYWLVNEQTLLAHQLPFAVVSMRPERVLTEMRTYWDYGIISEACPTARRCVLGDSDEFLMIELRRAATSREQIALGRPSVKEIAEKLQQFITKDPLELSQHTLTLHSTDLPLDLQPAKDALNAYVTEVVKSLPGEPFPYINHPIWAYHYPRFQKARQEYHDRRQAVAEAGGGAQVVEPAAPSSPPDAAAPLEAVPLDVSADNSLPPYPLPAQPRLFALLLGMTPQLRPEHPNWADLQPVLRVLRSAREERILVLSSEGGGRPRFRGLDATYGLVNAETLDRWLVPGATGQSNYDLCICELGRDDLFDLPAIIKRITRVMNSQGRILVHHVIGASGDLAIARALIANNALEFDVPCTIHFAGSDSTIAAWHLFTDAVRGWQSARPREMLRGLFTLMRAAWLGRAANQKPDVIRSMRNPGRCTSFTIELQLPSQSQLDESKRGQGVQVESPAPRPGLGWLGTANLRERVAELGARESILLAQKAALSERVEHLESHNRLLTQSATEMALKLQEKKELDYQILMTHQQVLAGIKDIDPGFFEIYEACRPFTMTSAERLFALFKSVEYIVKSGIPGDIAETGVWRGGSCMLIARVLIRLGDTARKIVLFDTFEGHPQPDAEKDVDLWGNRALDDWQTAEAAGEAWGHASLDDVRQNMLGTGYPADRISLVKGKVEDTLPEHASGELALLRLDTDWYESTRMSLHYLYPRLVKGGVLIVDDYGHYAGQRQAVDEYFQKTAALPLLNRVDYSSRIAVKVA